MKMLIKTSILPLLLFLHLGIKFVFADAFTFNSEQVIVPSVVHSVTDAPITILSSELSEDVVRKQQQNMHITSNQNLASENAENELLNTYAVLNN